MFAKLSCAIGAGLCVAAFPGSLAWLVPGTALGLIVVYENTTPAQERRALLTAARALLPGPLAADLAAFGQLPAKAKARYLLAGDVPLRPDERGDDNGDGIAEGDTQPLAVPINPLFAALESRPHRLIIGHTGGGKTTLIHDRATSWASQGQHVIVCDPDAAPGQWPGCTVAGGGDDYAGIARALATVDKEFKRRSAARSAGQRRFTPAHLVIDELQETIDHAPGAWNIIEPVLRRGRKLGLHCTLGVQDDQVETLGLHGKSHLLRNTVTVELYQDDKGQRQAAIKNRITDGRPLQTYPVPTLASPEDLIVAPEPEPELPTLARRAPEPAQVVPHRPIPPGKTIEDGYCLHHAIGRLIGRDPAIGSWPRTEEFPSIAQRLGLEWVEGQPAAHALTLRRPMVVVYQTGEGIGHAEYRTEPFWTLHASEDPPLIGLFRLPAGTITLAELALLAPSLAAKRGYVPTDQERAALAGLLEIDEPAIVADSQHVIDRSESGPRIEQRTSVHFHGAGRRGAIPGRAVGTDRRKARADRERRVRQLVAEGRSANEIDRLMPGERKAVLALVRQIKAEQAGPGGS